MNDSGSGGLTRRGLLRGASVIAGASLLLPSAPRGARAGPLRGGVMRFGLSPGLFGPLLATASHGYLTEVAADSRLTGALAETWESADAVTWRLKLRRGVTFHSGKTLTVADAIASLDAHRRKPEGPLTGQIAALRGDGGALVVTLHDPNAEFPSVLSDPRLPVMPARDGRIDPTSPDGCGAYRIDGTWRRPGVRLTRNSCYWKPDRAWLDGVELAPIPDAAARQQALLSGQVDVIDRVAPSAAAMLTRAGMRLVSATGPRHLVLPADGRTALLSDRNIRLAMKFGIDRQALLDVTLAGHGSPGNDHPIAPSHPFHNDALPRRDPDPDRARYHLKRAGLDKLEVTLSTGGFGPPGPEVTGAALHVATGCQQPNGAWDSLWMKRWTCAGHWSGGGAESPWPTHADAPRAEGEPNHGRLHALSIAAGGELDQTRRRQIWHEMQWICAEEGSTVIPIFAAHLAATARSVVTPDGIGAGWPLDGLRAPERWWLDR